MGQIGGDAGCDVGEMPVPSVLQQVRAGDLTIVVRHRSPADEQVRISVAVKIEGGYAGSVDVQAVKGAVFLVEITFSITQIHAWGQVKIGAIEFIPAAGHDEYLVSRHG